MFAHVCRRSGVQSKLDSGFESFHPFAVGIVSSKYYVVGDCYMNCGVKERCREVVTRGASSRKCQLPHVSGRYIGCVDDTYSVKTICNQQFVFYFTCKCLWISRHPEQWNLCNVWILVSKEINLTSHNPIAVSTGAYRSFIQGAL